MAVFLACHNRRRQSLGKLSRVGLTPVTRGLQRRVGLGWGCRLVGWRVGKNRSPAFAAALRVTADVRYYACLGMFPHTRLLCLSLGSSSSNVFLSDDCHPVRRLLPAVVGRLDEISPFGLLLFMAAGCQEMDFRESKKKAKWTCIAPIVSITRPLSAQMWITQSYLQIHHICLSFV